jgi:hypothetical protein
MIKMIIRVIWFLILYVLIYFFCVFLQVVYLNMNFWLSVSVNLVSIFTLLFIVDLIIKKITKNDNYIQK